MLNSGRTMIFAPLLAASSIIVLAAAILRSSSNISGLNPTAATVNGSVTRLGIVNSYNLYVLMAEISGKAYFSLFDSPRILADIHHCESSPMTPIKIRKNAGRAPCCALGMIRQRLGTLSPVVTNNAVNFSYAQEV